MPWFDNIIPDYIKKSVCTCLIKRYLSQFIENEIRRDQLNLDLYNGRGTAERISLAVEAINELGEAQNWPVEFVDGYIEKIDISVPWTAILKESAFVEITGLKITVQPTQRNEDATSMFESMWNSMTSSMHLAEEFAKEEVAAEKAQVFEGIELFAQTIENIIGRIKIKFVDTVVQMEHVPKESIKGVGILFKIALMEYCDESGNDPTMEEMTDLTNEDSKKAYIINSFTTKKLSVEGIEFSTVEFLSCARTFSRSLIESRISNQNETETPKEELFFDPGDEDLRRSSRKSSKDSSDGLNSENDRHVIMCGRFSSRQEIRIRLKQSEDLIGPKVAIEVNLGFLNLFLSPRQFHIIVELTNGFSTPSMEDNSNVAPRQKAKSKQMTDGDYQKVEEELQQLLNPFTNYQTDNLQGTHGWSTGPMDESSDSFLPMKDNIGEMYDSNISGISSSMESSITSSTASFATEPSQQTRRRVSNIDADPTAEISRFQIRLASIALVLLHEDLLAGPTGNEHILVKHMQNTAKEFFDKLHYVTPLAYNVNEFDNIRRAFDNACHLNHIRLFAAPVQIEADEKTTTSAFSINGQLIASKLELLECLYNDTKVKYVPLLQFDTPSEVGSPTAVLKPSVKIKLKHVQRTGRSRVSKKNGPRTELNISLNNSTAEVDISIIDRISALLHHPPVCTKEEKNRWNRSNVQTQFVNTPVIDSILDLKVSCPAINIKLIFPVPDFRPPHDMSKFPWWERNVRQDFLSLILTNVIVSSVFRTSVTFQEYVIESTGLDVYYYESENCEGLHIGKAGSDERFSSIQDASSNIRLSIKVCPKQVFSEDAVPSQDPMTHSCYGAFENQSRSQPGPFSAKRVVHESDTPHAKQFKGSSISNDSEELIIPGDKAEIDEFIKSTSSNVQIHLNIFLPTISAHLKSKHIYELIYNRINNDLLLWEPGAPKPNATVDASAIYYGVNNFDGHETFLMCKSGIQIESESESDESDSENTNVFYSTYDNKMKYSQRKTSVTFKPDTGNQSTFIFNLKIGQGLVGLNPPVRDVATNNVLPGQQGEFVLNINDAHVFVVSGYKGDENLGYVCVQMHKAFLFHCDMQPEPSSSPPLREIGSTIGKKLFPTIYNSDSGALADCKNRGGSRQMFTVAVKIQAKHETHHVKTVQVSLGLNKATLRHKMCNEPNTWISHLLDFFNVQDYPIPGYHAKDVLTELHLHLWDCAIDYRPLHLPIRAVLSIGNFSLSSHLTAVANTSTLRFIFEECGLFLSEKSRPKDAVDLKRDFVNVIDLGLFEISLKTSDKKVGRNPHLDLRAFNNKVIIRTCSDSGRALMQLITYYANDGDLVQKDEAQKDSPVSSPRHEAETELLSMESQESNVSKTQQEQVSEMLVEAIEDSDKAGEGDDDAVMTGAKLFFFPDEKNANQDTQSKPFPQVTTELGDVTYRVSKNSDTDDEFCIVGNEPGLGLFPKDGVPEITWFTLDPVKINDNHFAIPVGKRDLLQPPKGFPTPVMRYTLCEMTIVWQMYGGNDFKIPEAESKTKQVRFSETQLSDSVSFSNTKRQVTINNNLDKKKEVMDWKLRGGENRDHSLLMELELTKLRFQHEVYPETTEQASRQVLLVSDVEVRDKLDINISKIHKFLYQFDSQTKPKKSNANMVVIKALHIRPDTKLKAQECCIKISLLPLRLNIDQDALLFLINFFKELGGDTDTAAVEEKKEEPTSNQNTPTHQIPVMTISTDNEEEIKQQAQKAVNENLILLMEESKMHYQPEDNCSSSTGSITDESPVYFRKVVFSPDVFIRLDYNGKRVDMTHGPLAGLLMGLGQLKCSELRLKRIVYRHGLLGFSKLLNYLVQEWLTDIKKNQLGTILGGVGPMHALLQVFQGVRDLFWLPIEQYQKDGRIIRGLQRGANSFTTLTAVAALELTTRIIYLIQLTAETAYDMLSPGPSIRSRRLAKIKGKKKRYHQPQDIREGFTNACMVVKEGIGETADNIVQVASLEKEQKGYSGAVGGVLRQVPATILKPVIIGSEAMTNVLGGMQSQLVPDARREANQKWKSSDV